MRMQRKKPGIKFDSNGVANGWKMVVKTCFRQQLDIRPTTYIRTRKNKDAALSDNDFLKQFKEELDVIDYHRVKHADGTEKWMLTAWAQGSEPCFDRGHSFHGVKGEATEQLSLQILEASPANSTTSDPGTVLLIVYHIPNGPDFAAIPIGIATLTQYELVEFLENGGPPLKLTSGYDQQGKKIVAIPCEILLKNDICVFNEVK